MCFADLLTKGHLELLLGDDIEGEETRQVLH